MNDGAWWVLGYYDPNRDTALLKGPYSTVEGANRNARSMRTLWHGMKRVDVRWSSEPTDKEFDSSDSWCGR